MSLLKIIFAKIFNLFSCISKAIKKPFWTLIAFYIWTESKNSKKKKKRKKKETNTELFNLMNFMKEINCNWYDFLFLWLYLLHIFQTVFEKFSNKGGLAHLNPHSQIPKKLFNFSWNNEIMNTVMGAIGNALIQWLDTLFLLKIVKNTAFWIWFFSPLAILRLFCKNYKLKQGLIKLDPFLWRA